MKHSVAHWIIAAAESGFLSRTDWRNWADAMILKVTPPNWLIEVSLSDSVDELVFALADRLRLERAAGLGVSISNLKLGFYWGLYLGHRCSLNELLTYCGLEADGGDTNLECEFFYRLLNELEAGRPPTDVEKELSGRLSDEWQNAQSGISLMSQTDCLE